MTDGRKVLLVLLALEDVDADWDSNRDIVEDIAEEDLLRRSA